MTYRTWDLKSSRLGLKASLELIIGLVPWRVTWTKILEAWLGLVSNDLKDLRPEVWPGLWNDSKESGLEKCFKIPQIHLDLDLIYTILESSPALKYTKPDLALFCMTWRTWLVSNNLDLLQMTSNTWDSPWAPRVFKTALAKTAACSCWWDSWSQTWLCVVFAEAAAAVWNMLTGITADGSEDRKLGRAGQETTMACLGQDAASRRCSASSRGYPPQREATPSTISTPRPQSDTWGGGHTFFSDPGLSSRAKQELCKCSTVNLK